MVGDPEVEDPSDDDDVVAAVVLGPELAVDVGEDVVEDRGAADAGVPVGLREAVDAPGGEEPCELFLDRKSVV